MTILIINGPSLNLLGEREPAIYGDKSYNELESTLLAYGKEKGIEIIVHQTNYEGMIIDLLQLAHQKNYTGVLLNAGAFTHYSYALYDAIKAIRIPVVEIHLSSPKTREEPFRKNSVIESVCVATYSGKGFTSYLQGIDHFLGDQS